MAKQRGLSPTFMEDLASGHLSPLLKRVQDDTSLDLQIRGDYLNVYYRGGSLLKVEPVKKKSAAYSFSFNPKYAKDREDKLQCPPPVVADIDGCEAWINAVPELKDTMDLWFGKHPKDERALQQMVVWENNDGPWANGTDYFIVDIEYDSRKGNSTKGEGGRFDLVAIKWESTPSARSLRSQIKPRLVIIEMKAGDGALKGSAGLQDHVNVLGQFAGSSARKQAFIQEMVCVFNQKYKLGLIKRISPRKSMKVPDDLLTPQDLDTELDFMLLFAGHDPASKQLSGELKALKTKLPLQICTASFMGFGLYKENVYEMPVFMARYAGQI